MQQSPGGRGTRALNAVRGFLSTFTQLLFQVAFLRCICHMFGSLPVGSSETLIPERNWRVSFSLKPLGKTLIGPAPFNYPILDQSLCQKGGAQWSAQLDSRVHLWPKTWGCVCMPFEPEYYPEGEGTGQKENKCSLKRDSKSWFIFFY